jgi:hypothetical protein
MVSQQRPKLGNCHQNCVQDHLEKLGRVDLDFLDGMLSFGRNDQQSYCMPMYSHIESNRLMKVRYSSTLFLSYHGRSKTIRQRFGNRLRFKKDPQLALQQSCSVAHSERNCLHAYPVGGTTDMTGEIVGERVDALTGATKEKECWNN